MEARWDPCRVGMSCQRSVEYFGQYATKSDFMHNADDGLMYLISQNILLNASFRHSLFAEEYNRFVMLGMAIRLPK